MSSWYTREPAEVIQQLGADTFHGLSNVEAADRLALYGPNELVERGTKSPWRIIWEQLTATMVVILIVAALLSAALGDYKDAIAILVIVVINAILGFSQEYRAEQAIAALKRLAVPTVKVRRDGHVREISARELVPGDIVLLEAGNLVPADGRVLESANLRVQEAALTGESEPVDKERRALSGPDLPLGDRRNMVYMGTIVAYGRGLAVVTETGMQTELGAIATMIQAVDSEPTPLQKRLDNLGLTLAGIALAIVAVIFVQGLLRGEGLKVMFLTAVSMAVAAVPEGLPAVVTIALALGAQRMLKRHALIRKLPAVETLGSVTVICSDKTGTITENRMTITVLDVAGHRADLSADRRWVAADPPDSAQRGALHDQSTLALLLAGGTLCSDALLEPSPDPVEAGVALRANRAVGDPTEVALVVAAERMGLSKAELEAIFPRVAELPFDSERKRMTTVHAAPAFPASIPDPLAMLWDGRLGVGGLPYVAFTKGAVDSLLEVSSAIWADRRAEPLDVSWRARISATNDRLAEEGMRVLGVAFRPLASPSPDKGEPTLERDLIFIGLVGMIDPARPEVKDAVQTCRNAGIRPVLITGDHPLTARAIARELGISADGRALSGPELDRLSVEELERVVDKVSVYARVSPEHKLKIVQALQDRGHIVAMTGDGVNDAPALKKADIGVAMGIAGTDVAKEAADMVLQDDNFATIVAAVSEGRVIYDNIRKFIKYLLTTNSGELWVMLLGPLLGMPLPLLPLQILWMNLVTDGLPALALSVEPPERNTMQRPPYRPSSTIFGRRMGRDIILGGLLMGLISLGVGYWYWSAGRENWQTMLFTTLTLTQMANVLAIRSEHDLLIRVGPLSNKPLIAAIVLTFVLQLALIYIPFLQEFFSTGALSAVDLAISLLLSSVIFWEIELEKWLGQRHRAQRALSAR